MLARAVDITLEVPGLGRPVDLSLSSLCAVDVNEVLT